MPQSKYKQNFPSDKGAKALELALDLRKFEIELYWKRATYFWAFTGAAFAGYLTVLTGKEIKNRPEALLLVSCLGLVFSFAWYFVNRASKFWQANWEAHVDLLEDDKMGPIYKTVLNEKFSFFEIDAPYPFSVSKINQLISFFVFLVFAGLVANTLYDHYTFAKNWEAFPSACVGITVLALILLFLCGRTGNEDKSVVLHQRKASVSEYDG